MLNSAVGTNVCVIGNEVAEKLFGSAERAIGKNISAKGKKVQIIGVIKKQGQSMIGGWQLDKSVMMPFLFARTFMDERRTDPGIMVQGTNNLISKAIKDDLRGTMRAIHKLRPTQEDDFASE